MFTVKHIDHSVIPPIEHLYQGERITHHPVAGNLGALEIRVGDTFIAGLWGGTVYVMNEAGRTVSRFDLPPEPPRGVRSAPLHHHPDCTYLKAVAPVRSDCDCGVLEDTDRQTASHMLGAVAGPASIVA
ncbi:hypothetical protein NKJ93_02290 [Mesorhizobium sp. M0028]|uniref:hypothetical protein n=1 Tax=Mesorhizobium sp. M0028 TaxID=2956849 RepID=UPI00333C7E80